MIDKIGRYYRTVKHLKLIQIRYQLRYRLRSVWRRLSGFQYQKALEKRGEPLLFTPFPARPVSLEFQNTGSNTFRSDADHSLNIDEPRSLESAAAGTGSSKSITHNPGIFNGSGISNSRSSKSDTFSFLNQTHTFDKSIDWNFGQYGKLWTYNLNYFDFLLQPGLPCHKGLSLMQDFISQADHNREGLEPYPVSLRTVNWIKFLSRHKINSPDIDAHLYAQYRILLDNLEYHLLGNHLLENGFSLLIGGFYFRDRELFNKGGEIVSEQLEEQLLDDGGHFERSPMYHAIILERVLDCINLMKNNPPPKNPPPGKDAYWSDQDHSLFLSQLEYHARRMLSWMDKITFQNGDWPMMNDSAPGIAPASGELIDYASRLDMETAKLPLSGSGYRMLHNSDFEICLDAGKLGPDYIPGHAHADTLSFVLHHNRKPVIVDPGISTYESNSRRLKERSTSYHNTVMIGGAEQSEVWSSFRVGRRANARILEDRKTSLRASHDGYRFLGTEHHRLWRLEGTILIIDDQIYPVSGSNSGPEAKAFLHFHPGTRIEKQNESRYRADDLIIVLSGAESITLTEYNYALGFNHRITAKKLIIAFSESLRTEIISIQT